MHFSLTTAAIDVNSIPRECMDQDDWLAFNRQLDRDAKGLPNEAILVHRLDTVQALEAADERLRWLTVARIAELALKLAGDYADIGAFRAAGDLLVNPRTIDVYQQGSALPTPKIRHGALSEQFADAIGDDNPVVWMNRYLLPHVRTEALLPQLNRMLESSGCMTVDYSSNIEDRMCRIADTIAFLSAWKIVDSEDLLRRLEAAGNEERETFEENMCHFSLDDFAAMGEDIFRWTGDRRGFSRYIKCTLMSTPIDRPCRCPAE